MLKQLLEERREEILRIAGRYGARNVRVFGSGARCDDAPDSDGRVLVLVHTFSEVSAELWKVRIISARKATRREAAQYQEETWR